MAIFTYDHAKHLMGQGEIDLENDDLRVLLVMTNSTAGSQPAAETLSGITTLDEHDGAGYARKALESVDWSKNVGENRSELHCDDIVWEALGAGTRNAQALVLYKHLTDDTDSIPIAYIDEGGFPWTATGADVTYKIGAGGIWQQR